MGGGGGEKGEVFLRLDLHGKGGVRVAFLLAKIYKIDPDIIVIS